MNFVYNYLIIIRQRCDYRKTEILFKEVSLLGLHQQKMHFYLIDITQWANFQVLILNSCRQWLKGYFLLTSTFLKTLLIQKAEVIGARILTNGRLF